MAGVARCTSDLLVPVAAESFAQKNHRSVESESGLGFKRGEGLFSFEGFRDFNGSIALVGVLHLEHY